MYILSNIINKQRFSKYIAFKVLLIYFSILTYFTLFFNIYIHLSILVFSKIALTCHPNKRISDIIFIHITKTNILPILPYIFEYLEKLFIYILNPFDKISQLKTVIIAPGNILFNVTFFYMDILYITKTITKRTINIKTYKNKLSKK